jgi:hypothetical protein
MRSALIGPLPLLGSLGLHAAIALGFFLAVRHVPKLHEYRDARPDVWVGNAVEVDAVATPDEAANPSNAAVQAAPGETTAAASAPTAPASTAEVAALPARPKPEEIAAEPTRSKQSTARDASQRATPQPKNTKSSALPSSGDASERATQTAPASGAFGGEGLPPGVRSLPSAFTRAIPAATAADPIWQTSTLGTEHPFSIAIEIDDEGHIASAEILREKDGAEPQTQAQHLRERVIALLGAGQFALQNEVAGGHAVFRLTITLSDESVSEDELAQLPKKGFEPPSESRPGRAYFTLVSGRHFEAKVQVLAAK